MEIRALEKYDLINIHSLNNSKAIMGYWFEEPYESLDELYNLYEKHIHDNTERRFVIEVDNKFTGVIELVEISFLHRNCEVQVALLPEFQGLGLAEKAMKYAIDYAFNMLNLQKVYLYVDVENEAAVHIYEKLGFQTEGRMIQQFYANGRYHDSYFMGLFKDDLPY